MRSRNGKITIPKENIWVHSDSEDETTEPREFDEWTDFFVVMKIIGDELDQQQELEEQVANQNHLQTIKMLSSEYEQFQKWKAAQSAKPDQPVSAETPSKIESIERSKSHGENSVSLRESAHSCKDSF